MVARALHRAFGPDITVADYCGDKPKQKVRVVSGARPDGLTAMGTCTLHLSPTMVAGHPFLGEVLALARDPQFAHVLSSVAVEHFDGEPIVPEHVFRDVISEYRDMSPTLTSVVLGGVMEWPELVQLELPAVSPVYFLQAVAISDAEADLIEKGGYREWQDRMLAGEIDYTDLTRKSVV